MSLRIAMWSGPRNISTAMMRAWGSRNDTVVIDEPFYPYYLKVTCIEHPGADEVIATGETDWQKVVAHLTGSIANGKRIFFQKQMTHHLLPEIDRGWLGAVTNCFLIRDPREVISSYAKKREDPALEDLGFVQQAEIFDFVRSRTNAVPPVVDARDVLQNRPLSSHIAQDIMNCLKGCTNYTSAAAIATKSYTSTDWSETRKEGRGQE